MPAGQVLKAWIAAWHDDDRAALRVLFPADATLHVAEPEELRGDYRGIEGAAEYFRRKADLLGDRFRWEAGDILEAGPYAAIPFKLLAADDAGAWWQLAVYRVVDGHIAEAWLFEEPR